MSETITKLPHKVPAIILTSMHGVPVDAVCESIRRYGVDDDELMIVESFSVEKHLKEVVEEKTADGKDRYPTLPTERRIRATKPYNLPLNKLTEACDEALRRTFAAVRAKADSGKLGLALITLHSVFMHQRTRSFLQVYQSGALAHAAEVAHVEIRAIATLHDDIYDVYTNLLSKNEIVGMSKREGREPLRDISDLMLLLEWRDRQLTTDRFLCDALKVRHFLFHCKGRVKTFWDVSVKGKPCIYVSHAISQVRRDWAGKAVDGKCRTPKKERGDQLMKDIRVISDNLGRSFAIVEPTCIDELRINVSALGSMSPEQLRNAVLPPLTRRWDIGDGIRLYRHDDGTDVGDGVRLVPIREDIFARFYSKGDTTAEKGTLEAYREAVGLLIAEIVRQITVRDFALAEQADLIVVIRPYSNEEFPELSGGVDKEITTMQIRALHGSLPYKHPIVVYHPDKDESTRRSNSFDIIYKTVSTEASLFSPSNDELISELKNLMQDWSIKKDSQELERAIEEILRARHVSGKAKNAGTMGAMDASADESLRLEVAKKLAESTIVFDQTLINTSGLPDPLVRIFNGDPYGTEFVLLLKSILKGAEDVEG